MNDFFMLDQRVGIEVPYDLDLLKNYDENQQMEIMFRWEQIRGTIPEKVKDLEVVITSKQSCLDQEENFQLSCRLNSEIAELAATINELLLWYRFQIGLSEVH